MIGASVVEPPVMFEAKTFAVWVGEAVPVAVPGAPGMMSCVEKYLKLTQKTYFSTHEIIPGAPGNRT